MKIHQKPECLQMVEELRRRGVTDHRVLEVMTHVPRHAFVPPHLHRDAYKQDALDIGEGQTISRPHTVAFQSQLLDVKRGMKVLEIGTGSGYQCAVLCALGARVYSIERQRALYQRARHILQSNGYHPTKLIVGDGFKGIPAQAPFDRIIVTAGAPMMPERLVDQLSTQGRMVIPVGGADKQTMILVTKTTEGKVVKQSFEDFTFVPMLPNIQ